MRPIPANGACPGCPVRHGGAFRLGRALGHGRTFGHGRTTGIECAAYRREPGGFKRAGTPSSAAAPVRSDISEFGRVPRSDNRRSHGGGAARVWLDRHGPGVELVGVFELPANV